MAQQVHVFQSKVCYSIPGRFKLDLELKSNQRVTALIGPSGAGKTTVLKLIAGWLDSNSTVALNGSRLDLNRSGKVQPLRDRGVGMVFQDDLLFPHLDVLANAQFAIKYARHERPMEPSVFDSLCHNFGVVHLLERKIFNLSGGERQRVGLVRALAARPKLLLCDEPVSAVDRAGRTELLANLQSWTEREQIVVIMVTHDHDEIRRMAGHVWHLDAGQLIAEGSPDSVV
jgi:ABC-type molybdate transport system ATPase subunit